MSLVASELEMGQNWKATTWYFPALQPGCNVSLRRYHLVFRDMVCSPSGGRPQRDVEMDAVDYRGFHVDVYRDPGRLGSVYRCPVLLQVWQHETWKT